MFAPLACARRREALIGWGLLVPVVCGHWLLFSAYVRREVAWSYARHFDQTTLLYLAYGVYEEMLRDGPVAALARALRASPPIGATLHLEAALVFLLARPTRLTALAVNWGHFVLLQAAVIAALRARTRGWALPALGLGLVWALRTPFFWVGGLDDFRLDFAACCLYGTFLALVLRSDLFRHAGWSVAAGLAATWCVLTRSLTSVYLVGLLGLWILVLFFRLWRAEGGAARADRGRALRGAALCTACLALLALPTLALRARSLWSYYVVGHVTGREGAVHAALSGAGDAWKTIAYYPTSLLASHAGPLFLWLAGGALVVLALARRSRGPGEAEAAPVFAGEAFGFMVSALAVPLAVLTADTAKSPVVGGILVTPLLWAVLLALSRLAPRARPAALWVTSGAVLAAGGAFQVYRLTGPARSDAFAPSVEARTDVSRLHDDITRVIRQRGLTHPWVLTDRKRDYVPALHVSAYERHGQFLYVNYPLLPVLWKPSNREVLEALRRSDFVILTAPGPLAKGLLPYDYKLAEMEPRLRDHCTRRLTRVGTYRVPEEIDLYARLPGPVPDAEKNGPLDVDRGLARSTLP
jgi:hypothetical protein